MCDINATDSIVVGPAGTLREVLGHWPDLRAVRRHSLERQVQLSTLGELGHHWDDEAPAILTVAHEHLPGHLVADDLTIELTMRHGYDVACETSYRIGLAADAGYAPGPWEVELYPEMVARAHDALAAFDGRWERGRTGRVAVVDSGDTGSFMLDMLGVQPGLAPGTDLLGHGTAVCRLIQELRPDAEIHPVRVLARDPGEARHLLLGLIAALWPDQDGSARYDVVNVSMSRQLVDECATSLGRTLAYVNALCERRGTVPPVVAAIGNRTSGQQFGYPAAFPGATPVRALAWDGSPATYNVDVPATIRAVDAYGGTPVEPYGYLTGPGRVPLYGTSFAAALVTAARFGA